MLFNIKKLLKLFIVLAIIMLCFFGISKHYGESLATYIIFLGLVILYHILIDKPRSKAFIQILSLFLLVFILRYFYHHTSSVDSLVVYIIEITAISALVLILWEVFKASGIRFILTWHSALILVVLTLDALVIYKIVILINQFQLGMDHMAFGFIFTIIKMMILSAGLIYYLLSDIRSRKLSFLNGALAMFFASDLIDTLNYLYFVNDPIAAGLILQNGLSIIGIGFLYVYFTYPEHTNITETRNK